MKKILSNILSLFLFCSLSACNASSGDVLAVRCKNHQVNNYSLKKQPTTTEMGVISGECTLCGETVEKEVELIDIQNNLSEYFDISHEQSGIIVNITCKPKNELKNLKVISLKEPISLYLSSLSDVDIKISFILTVKKYDLKGEVINTRTKSAEYEYSFFNPPQYQLSPTLSVQIGDTPKLNADGSLKVEYTYDYCIEIYASKVVVLK